MEESNHTTLTTWTLVSNSVSTKLLVGYYEQFFQTIRGHLGITTTSNMTLVVLYRERDFHVPDGDSNGLQGMLLLALQFPLTVRVHIDY